MDFQIFKAAVAKQFKMMQNHQLYRVDVSKDKLWETYLSSFPEGSDPIYKERTEHDCNCCKQFIRAVGDVVAIIDDKLVSIWDVNAGDPNYQAVSDSLATLVKSGNIADVFFHFEKTAGTNKNYQDTVDGVKTWDHFFVNIDAKFVKHNSLIPTELGKIRSLHDVFSRSLNEITDDAIDTVLELISQNTLYRGAEHKFVVEEFRKLKQQYNKIDSNIVAEVFTWERINRVPASVASIRNTVIGSLLTDLSEDKDLEYAVKSFESKVAPTNYKRPTALVTKAMVDKAKKTIEDLGLTSALERRYANINDITINNILFANRDARKSMNADVFDEIASKISEKSKKLDKVDEINIDKFISDILPHADSIEIMMENSHTSNLMSLIAPVDATAKPLFKWDNNFSWSYNGDVADSIKERVKAAGGSVTGDLCCRLAWNYKDDLDFHMEEPDRNKIYFGVRRQLSSCGGMLDLDANGVDGQRDDPAENIFYNSKAKMKEGIYILKVHNYNRRSDGVGFEVEVEFDGQIHHFVYDKVIGNNNWIEVAQIKYSKKSGFEIIKSLPSTTSVKTVWGINTNTFQKVNVMMTSPNYWDEHQVGNKHYFFMIDGCINDGKARGFYNEFLKEELNQHRKVIEMVGSKMKTEESDKQLSGLGFSSTQRNSILCKVTGKFSRIVKINF
jgi:hypothetical protein